MSALLAEGGADAVLEFAAVVVAHDALVDDGETELAPVAGGQIAGKGRDAGQRARLGAYVTLGGGLEHALLEGAVDSGHRQGGQQVLVDGRLLIGVAQETDEQFGRHVVVERQAGAVGYLVGIAAQSEALDELAGDGAGVGGLGGAAAGGCGGLVEEGLGVEVVALFHHAHQYLVDMVTIATDEPRIAGHDSALLHLGMSHADALPLELLDEGGQEDVLATDGEGYEHGVVVVPAPAFAVVEHFLHGAVADDAAADAVDAHVADALGHDGHVVRCQRGVEAADAVDVALQGAAGDGAGVVDARLVFVVAAQLVEGGDGGDEFHA